RRGPRVLDLVARLRPRPNSSAQRTCPCRSPSTHIRPFPDKPLMDVPLNRGGAVAALSLLVLALVGASVLPLHTPGTPGLSHRAPVRDMATSGLNFDYLVTIIMENHNLCEIYAHCGGTGVYMTALADAYSISLQ